MKNKIFLLSPDISFKTFKLLQKKLVIDSGPTPLHGDEALWELMREKKIYCWFEKFGDMRIGQKLPKNCEIEILSDGTKKNHIGIPLVIRN